MAVFFLLLIILDYVLGYFKLLKSDYIDVDLLEIDHVSPVNRSLSVFKESGLAQGDRYSTDIARSSEQEKSNWE